MRPLGLQFALFLAVGAVTTALDVLVYNLILGRFRRCGRIGANVASCTVAMTFSFAVNWHLVFLAQGAWAGRAARFVLITCASSYGLQNLVIYSLTRYSPWPAQAACRLIRRLPWARSASPEFVDRNAVKAAAVAAGLLWNFAWYRWFVYA